MISVKIPDLIAITYDKGCLQYVSGVADSRESRFILRNFYRKAAEQILWPKIDQEFQGEIDEIVAGIAARKIKACYLLPTRLAGEGTSRYHLSSMGSGREDHPLRGSRRTMSYF